jgi:hypothetical protein
MQEPFGLKSITLSNINHHYGLSTAKPTKEEAFFSELLNLSL